MTRQLFFVQAAPKDQWHIETDDNCEVMLCGKRISVDLWTARVQSQWGPRRCADCYIALEKRNRLGRMARPR